MVFIPYGQNRPNILWFEFRSGRLPLTVITSFWSPEEALANYRETRGEFIETEIVVLARKGKYKHPVTHKLASLEKDHPGVPFIAAIDARIFQQMCRAADAEWEKDKEARRAIIRH